ncbi:MAG: ATP-binding cassette domain-containing protein [Candidatus Methanosuratincola petrocarbonis]
MPHAIFVKDLVKEFSRRRAVDGISLEVEEGEVFGLIGPNGAGKTTTLRIIATIIKPTSGLDVTHAFQLRRLIKEYADRNRITVLLSSHNMLEVEKMCDRVAFINAGRVVEAGQPGDLVSKYGADTLEEAFMKVVGFA